MTDIELRREYHRLCKQSPGTLSDTEACFRAFVRGFEFGGFHATTERADRIMRLISERGMTEKAAVTVIDAAMGIDGCVEGEVRAKIEREKHESQTLGC